MARFSALALLALASSAAAFMPSFTPRSSFNALNRGSASQATCRTSVRMMAEVEAAPTAESLAAIAQACQEDGCSVEAVNELLDQLKFKKNELEMQLQTVNDVIEMMGPSMSEPGELEKLVMAVQRVFTLNDDDYPYLSYPTGWTGEINQEKKTAWDYNVNTPLKPRKPVYSKK